MQQHTSFYNIQYVVGTSSMVSEILTWTEMGLLTSSYLFIPPSPLKLPLFN